MSEFTDKKKLRVEQLVDLFKGIIIGDQVVDLVRKNDELIQSIIPTDIIDAVDQMVLLETPMNDLKRGVNKVLNLLFKTIQEHPYHPPEKESCLGIFIQNYEALDGNLKAIRPLIKKLNKDGMDADLREELKDGLSEIEKFRSYYLIKENVLFPLLETEWKNFRCLQVMWSFQDDIRKNIQTAIEQLSTTNFDLKLFNRLVGDIFFNVYAIKFRDERILFPMIQETITEDKLDALLHEAAEIGFPYIHPAQNKTDHSVERELNGMDIDLNTGFLSPEQVRLLFNHLPVDITFVDEHDKVKYFSTPSKRIFPRTKAIIGRDVKNCHPPESMHVVEQIVEAFKKGEKSEASFWIRMKKEFILIQYFAIRDEKGKYKGVVEVSQEISELQTISGEKRLLDWK